jgi:hypothetical protein
MTLAFSRFMTATMVPSRQAGDILSGMWTLICGVGRVTKTLLWDRESAIGGTGRVSTPAAAFAGTLATQIKLAPPRDPEYKGMVERHNGFLETSFLPGRTFASPADFNAQLVDWLARANTRTVRSIQGRPVDLLEVDYRSMLPLPPLPPPVGLNHRIRLGRDYYVRVDTVDYSVDPRVIGKFVDVTASPSEVSVSCDGQIVACHTRSWAKQAVVTDPAHVATAAQMRQALALQRQSRQKAPRHHADGHTVMLRALPDYDALFGVDFNPHPNQSRRRVTSEYSHQVQTPSHGAEGRDAVDDRLPGSSAEDAHHRRVLGRTGRPGPRRELVTRGVPGSPAATPGRRPGVQGHHHAHPHRPLPSRQDTGGLQPRPSALAAP